MAKYVSGIYLILSNYIKCNHGMYHVMATLQGTRRVVTLHPNHQPSKYLVRWHLHPLKAFLGGGV